MELLRITLAFVGALSSIYYINGWILRPRWRPAESSQAVATSQWELRQRFLLDLMLQVHKPLLQQELIEMGSKLNENENDYEEVSRASQERALDSRKLVFYRAVGHCCRNS